MFTKSFLIDSESGVNDVLPLNIRLQSRIVQGIAGYLVLMLGSFPMTIQDDGRNFLVDKTSATFHDICTGNGIRQPSW